MINDLHAISLWHKYMTFTALVVIGWCAFLPAIIGFIMIPVMFMIIYICSSVAVRIDDHLEGYGK